MTTVRLGFGAVVAMFVEGLVRLEAAVVVIVVAFEREFISAPSLSEPSSELDPDRELERDPSAEWACLASFVRRDWRKSCAGRGREGGNSLLSLDGHLARSFH